MKKVILLALLVPLQVAGQNTFKPGDVIITEIMADPDPVVGLPGKEYLEIHNLSDDTVNLKSWVLSDGNSRAVFPERELTPGSYAIVCQQQDTSLFSRFGNTIGLKSFPALTNSGKLLFLSDSRGKVIHGLEYSAEWYDDVLREDGGWSLEIIDEGYPFHEEGNWRASRATDGGTPGRKNSVSAFNPDTFFGGFENVFPIDSVTISLNFTESLLSYDDIGEFLVIEGFSVDTIIPDHPLARCWVAKLSQPLARGKVLSISAGDGLRDFAGNLMDSNEYSFGLPVDAVPGGILFNELLFNPFPGEPDYIEFYNSSGKVVDASSLILVSVNDETADTSSACSIAVVPRSVLPGYCYAITTDRKSVIERYYSALPLRLFEVNQLPSMPDNKGHLILFSRKLEKIDEVVYEERMHYSLLDGIEGISLEKVRPDGSSADRALWHSASESAGWGTPGAPNSVLVEAAEGVDAVSLSSERITPDNDGADDILIIDLKLEGPGNIVSMTVFDETGRFVKKIADNMLAGQGAMVVWNGTGADEKPVETGIYIFLITVFDDKGKTRRWKKVCTLIRE